MYTETFQPIRVFFVFIELKNLKKKSCTKMWIFQISIYLQKV